MIEDIVRRNRDAAHVPGIRLYDGAATERETWVEWYDSDLLKARAVAALDPRLPSPPTAGETLRESYRELEKWCSDACRVVPKTASAMQFGLMPANHVPQAPEELEQPILEALYTLRFSGASCPVGQCKGTFRLQSVPAPILRAWLRILPNELSSGADRLQSLGYIETRAGSIALPFGKRAVQNPQHPSQVQTELIVERPEGGHVQIIHVSNKDGETTIAFGGTYSDANFRIDDPGALGFSLSSRGSVPRYCLTARGVSRVEELRAKQPLRAARCDAEEPGREAKPPKVFICYCKEDYKQATDLYDYLKCRCASPWLDNKELVLGDDWEKEIEKAVATADVFVVCLRPGFDEIGFRQKEVRWAIDAVKRRPMGRGFIVPFIIAPCELPEWCRPFHAGADRSKPTSKSEVVRAIEKHYRTPLKRPDAR